ncbi:MAG TPA: GNAT family N-acetyltransferase, partial [Geminicoccaceae bacterium]|nr:GNAT family N-acetyltransferase [Geminicoccaceae bacterium]
PVREATAADAAWIGRVLEERWAGTPILADGRSFDALWLPALVAGDRQGLAIYEVAGDRAELVVLEALVRRRGIGAALLAELAARAARLGAQSLHLGTTNDNLDALRFYQRRGFRLAEVRPGAVDAYRAVKTGIALVGSYGIPVRDELRLVLELTPTPRGRGSPREDGDHANGFTILRPGMTRPSCMSSLSSVSHPASSAAAAMRAS